MNLRYEALQAINVNRNTLEKLSVGPFQWSYIGMADSIQINFTFEISEPLQEQSRVIGIRWSGPLYRSNMK